MALTDANGFPLKFEAEIDDKKARQKIDSLFKDIRKQGGETVKDILKDLNVDMRPAAESLKDFATQTKASTQATNTVKEAQLAYMDSLRQSRLEIQKQREEQARLKVAYDEGRISQQQYRIEAAKFSLEERKKAAALRDTKKEITNNSEYQKLSRALGTLRTESKNVLAEMYKLETQGKKGSTSYQDLANKARGLVSQTNALDTGLKKIDASLGLHQRNVGNYGSALDAISPQFARINSQMQMMGVNLTELGGSKNVFKELGASVISMGKSIGMFLISPIGLAITAIGGFFALIRGNAGTVKDFNSGLLNVSKTTGIAGAELDRLGDSIIGLSRSLQTVSTEKLLDYATVAGQLGVKGTANIMAFTEALAKLETASDITGEQGGSEIARLLTLTDGGVQNVKSFGDEIVNLGNNFAATESEILSNATAIAQNTGLYKVGRQDVLAYATATKAVGLEAEVVGSAMFRTLDKLKDYSNGVKGAEKVLSIMGITQSELSKQFKTDSASTLNDFITALNKVSRAGGDVSGVLRELGLNNQRDIRVLSTLASSGYGQLEQAMHDVRDAGGSLDEEFNAAAGKLENQTKRISIAWNNLVLDIENGTGALGKSAVWLSGVFADALDRISKIVAPTGWNEFVASLTNFKAADVIREINIAVKESGEAMQSAMDLDLSKANSDKITETMDALVSAQDQATKGLELYKKAIEDGLLTDKGRIKIAEHEDLLNRLSSKIYQVSMFVPVAKTGGTAGTEGGNTLTEAEIKAQARAHETMVNAQRAMQAKIDEMNQSAKRKNLKDSEEEIQAIKDKYAKLTEEAVRFNKDPKNKIKVNLSGLGSSESGEINEAAYKSDTALLKKGLDEQLKLYNDFEALKRSTSIKVAEERYRDQLDLIRGYEPKLQAEIAKLEANSNRSKEEEKRYNQLTEDAKKFNEARLKEEESMLVTAYNASITHAQKLLKAEAEYYDSVKALQDEATRNGEEVNQEQLDNLKKNWDKIVSTIAVDELINTDDWENLFQNLDTLTIGQIDKLIAEIESKFSDLSVKFDPIDLDAIRNKLNEARRVLIERNPFGAVAKFIKEAFNEGADGAKKSTVEIQMDWNNLADATEASFDFVRDAIESTDILKDVIGEVGSTAINSLMSIGSVAIAVAAAIKTAEKASVILAIVQAALVVVQTIANLFKSIFARHDKNIEQSIGRHKNSVEELERAYRNLERAVNDALGAEVYATQKQLIANIEQQNRAIDEMIHLEEKKKKTDQSKINDYKQQQQDNLNQIKDITKAISESIAQTTGKRLADELADALVGAFKNGELAAKSFEEVSRKVMENAVINALKLKFLEKPLQDAVDKLTDSMYTQRTVNFMGREIKFGPKDQFVGITPEAQKQFTDSAVKAGTFFNDAIAPIFESLGIKFGENMEGVIKDIGISLESVKDQFASLFASGTGSAEDFGKNFEDIMKSVIMNSFQTNFVAEAMKGFYQQILDLTESGNDLTEAEIALLRSQYESIVAEGQEKFAQLEKVTGMSFAVKKEIEEIKKEIDKVFSGFGDTIVDSLTKPFNQAGDTFQDVMKKAILSTFRDGVLEKELQSFYDMYADMTEGGASLNAAQIDLLRTRYDEIIAKGKTTIAELEAMTGVTLVQIEEIEEKIRENLTGTSLEGVADAITNMFAQGKSEAVDFAQTFEEVMKKAVLNIFRTNLLTGELKNFYDKFEEIAQGSEGLTAANMAELRLQYDLMMAGADARFRDLEKITGLSFAVIEEVQKAVEIARESIVGTTFESFADGIVEMLARGTTSVQEFGKSFEETMKTAILNTFKTKTLAAQMEAFYEQFYRYTDSGGMLTEVEIAALKVQYDKMIKDGRDKLDQIEKVTGMNFNTETSATGMAGGIRRELTEQTGGELAGLYRAQYDISKSLLALQTKEWAAANNYNRIGIERLMAIQANTFRTANNTEHNKRLENIESHLARLAGANGGLSANKTF